MRKYKNKLLVNILLLGIFLFPNVLVYAEEEKLEIDLSQINVNDKFEYNGNKYTISEVSSSDIYVSDEKFEIYNFEVHVITDDFETWRKYVKFDDLCSNYNICKDFSEKNSDEISLAREYKNDVNGKEVYYTTKYKKEEKTFESHLIVENDSYNFNSFKDENSIFNDEGILTADVESLVDSNNDLYVSLRFVTEALGAEVTWEEKENDSSNDKVNINFYDDDNYCKVINTSYIDSCENIDEEKLDKVSKCNEDDDECLSDRCKQYIKENVDNLDNSFEIILNYSYIDINDNLRKFEAKYKKEETYIDDDNLYMVIMYNGVPLPYNIFNDYENNKCKDDLYEEKLKCLEEGKSWITDETYIRMIESDKPFCSINMVESLSNVSET